MSQVLISVTGSQRPRALAYVTNLTNAESNVLGKELIGTYDSFFFPFCLGKKRTEKGNEKIQENIQ
jgi:hypothetical protein